MPNTLVHLGVQSVSTKAVFKDADFKWIAIGCIISDVPWIIQRIILVGQIGIDPFDLRQYVIVQASLFFCFILCGVLALFASLSTKIFLLLSANALIHLLFDAMQIKWANGVHFFAPFSWKLVSFNFVWPEYGISYVFTAAGFIALVYFGIKDWKENVVLTMNRSKYATAVILLAIYFILPFWLRFGPDKADNHYIATLRNVEDRSGRYLELDRSRYRSSDNTVEIFSGERIKVTGDYPSKDAILSVKGYFSDNKTVHVSSFHIHSPLRDANSKIALAGVLLIWLMALVKKKITVEKKS